MVKRNINRLLMTLCLAAALSPGQAQTETLKGYYRIQNGNGLLQETTTSPEGGISITSPNNHYVVMSDATYASPSLSYSKAQKDPGSVFYIETSDASDKYGEGALRINYLRSQGIELVGGADKMEFYNYWQDVYYDYMWHGLIDWYKHQVLRDAGAQGYLYTSRAIIESFIYDVANTLLKTADTDADKENIQEIAKNFNHVVADNLDIDAYLIPTFLKDNTPAYYWKWHTLNMQEVSDFFNINANMRLFQSGLNSMRTKLSMTSGQTIEPYEVPLLKMLGYDILADLPNLRTGKYPDNYEAQGVKNFYGLNDNGCGVVSYECIFTHPKLLFGWVKLNLFKMMYHDTPYPKMFGENDQTHESELYNFFRELGNNKLFLDYFIRYPYDADICLIDGYVSGLNTGADTDEFTPGDEYFKELNRFGFRLAKIPNIKSGEDWDDAWSLTDYSTYLQSFDQDDHEAAWNQAARQTSLDESEYGKTITNAPFLEDGALKDGAKWVFKKVNDRENAIFFKGGHKGLQDDNYYTSIYVDFPIDNAATNATFWKIGSDVTTCTLHGTTYNFVSVSEVTDDVIPADEPLIAEFPNDDYNIIVPAQSVAPKDNLFNQSESVLKGVFFNVNKTNATTNDAASLTDLSKAHENRLAKRFDYDTYTEGSYERLSKELTNRWGIACDKDLDYIYTLQYNTSDTHNPMGFYRYNSTTNALAKNKCFMVVRKAATGGAKIAFGDAETTGINNVTADNADKPLVIYDLQGRRVQQPATAGIYIVNGKKMFISK